MILKKYLPILLLICISLLIFGKVINFEFLTFDDNIYITENPVIASDSASWKDCFLYKYGNPDFFPIPNLVFRAERTLFGFNSKIFHGFNLLIYFINIVLVFLLSLKLFPRFGIDEKLKIYFSFFVALFFAIHPIHVESAAWIIDLKDLLSSAFYMLGMMSYINWMEKKKAKFAWISLLLAFLSIYSKSSGITFIASLFLLDWLYHKPLLHKQQWTKIPFLILTLIGLYTFGFFTPNEGFNVFSKEIAESTRVYYPPSIDDFHPTIQRFFMIIFRLVYWIIQSVFPAKQTVLYSRDLLLEEFSNVILLFPFILIGIGLYVFIMRKRMKFLLFGFAFFIISVAPTLAQSDVGASVFVPDRYLYFPLLGMILMITGLIFNQRKILTYMILLFFTLFWGYKTITYLPVWKSSERLYDRAIEYDPHCIAALNNRANIYMNREDKEAALKDLATLAKLGHDNIFTYLNLSKIYMDQNMTEKAKAVLKFAYQFDSTDFNVLFRLGRTYLKQDSLEDSRYYFSKAYLQDSSDFNLNKEIAKLYIKSNQYKVAIQFCKKCIEISPNDLRVLNMLAHAYFKIDELSLSESTWNKAIEIDSTEAHFWYGRHLVRKQNGDDTLAHDDLLKAKKLGFATSSDGLEE